MGKHWKSVVLVISALLITAVVTFMARGQKTVQPPEPSYKGKTLSEWMTPKGPWDQMAFEEAIRQIGTNAMPCLLHWIQYQEPEWKKALRSWTVNSRDKSREAYLAHTTQRVFEALGPDAKAYIPELTRLMNDTNTPASTSWWAIWGISYMGPEALPPLMNALTNPPGRLRNMAAIVIPHLGTNALPAIPLLVSCLTNSPEIDTTDCELALGELKLEPALVIPALTDRLTDSRPAVRRWAIESLGMFGPEAKLAIPLLQRTLNDPDQSIRAVTTNALRTIDAAEFPKTQTP